MDELLQEIEVYAAARGISPATVVQYAGAGNGSRWKRWKAKVATCNVTTAERLRAYMKANPPASSNADGKPAELDNTGLSMSADSSASSPNAAVPSIEEAAA